MSFAKLCIHTVTTKPWNLATAARKYARAGVGGISIWRDAAQAHPDGFAAAGRLAREEGLSVVSYVRGGFFAARDAAGRQAAIDDNRRVIDEAAAIGAPLIVLVCGAVPGQDLAASRAQIRDGMEAVLPHAEAAGVRLGIEPLHPMYADCRSAVVTLGQANDLCEALAHPSLGVTVDVYHVWWDDRLEAEIARAGRSGRLFSFHICDWRNEPQHLLNDRGLMGEGVIDIARIRGWVRAAGFEGFEEVEIFSSRYWAEDQDWFLGRIKKSYLAI